MYQVYIFLFIVLFQNGDIDAYPGPMLSSNQCLSVFYWNFNSLSIYNFAKNDLLIAFNSIHNFDTICLSETYLDCSYDLDDKDHPKDIKLGRVCVYYKDYLGTILNFSLLTEWIILEIEVDNKKISLLSLYRSPL